MSSFLKLFNFNTSSFQGRRAVQFRRATLIVFPTQSIRSSNADALDSPYLLVLNTGTSQSKQHESRKSPTAELFEVDSGRIFIRHCGMLKSITLNVLEKSQG
ncbi:hypothetical protein Tco_0548227 [Tanacetum coccineum]